MSLSPEQASILQEIKNGNNVFMTGCGGTGKSFTIKTILRELAILKGGSAIPWHMYLTAMTGCAAILLDSTATTLHSFAGIGLGDKSVVELVSKIRKNTTNRTRWRDANLLIIDEVSMLSAELFEKLEEIARIIRKNAQPFGGLQLLFSGDFYQLPPIANGNSIASASQFAFESPIWKRCFSPTSHIELVVNHRQKSTEFQKILHETRIGTLSDSSVANLTTRQGLPWTSLKIKPTLLFPRRKEVDHINKVNLDMVTSTKYMFTATIVNQSEEPVGNIENFNRTVDTMDKSTSSYSTSLVLAKDVQVMLTYNLNIEQGLVNGSRGIVCGFDILGLPIVEFINGYRMTIPQQLWSIKGYNKRYRSQIPLQLAYAITIHKSQGSTLDCALIDIGPDIFEYGQAYVALSRIRSLDSLYIFNFLPSVVRANPIVTQFYKQMYDIPVVTDIIKTHNNKEIKE